MNCQRQEAGQSHPPLGGGVRPLPAWRPGAPPLSHRCAGAAWIPSFLPGSSPIPASGMGYTARDQMLFEIWNWIKKKKKIQNLKRTFHVI